MGNEGTWFEVGGEQKKKKSEITDISKYNQRKGKEVIKVG